MAGEIKARISVVVENGPLIEKISPGQIDITQSNIGRGGHVQVIGTSEEVIDFGDIVIPGRLYLRNLDDTNFIDWGPESAGALVNCHTLKPGEDDWTRIKQGVVLRAKADTASVKLDVRLLED